MSVSVIRSFSVYYWSFLHFLAYTCESESKIWNVTEYKSNAKENVCHVQLTRPDSYAWYQSNLLMAHNIKISDICRKRMFGDLVLRDPKERMFRQWWHWLKLCLMWVLRQTLPNLGQTWSDRFFLGMTACYKNVELNVTQFRGRDFSPPEQRVCFASQTEEANWLTLCSALLCPDLGQA